MIVTLDTGILVRATSRSNGPARAVLERIISNPYHILALSPYILGEVGKVLGYPRLQRLLGLSPDDIHAYVNQLRALSRLVDPTLGIPVTLSDPKDDPVIYTAVAAGADVLCASDKAFFLPNVTAFCRGYGIEVMTDIQLLKNLH